MREKQAGAGKLCFRVALLIFLHPPARRSLTIPISASNISAAFIPGDDEDGPDAPTPDAHSITTS